VRGGTSPKGAAVAGHLRLVDLPVLAFVSLFFLLFCSFGSALLRPANLLYRVVGCYIIYSRAKACFEKLNLPLLLSQSLSLIFSGVGSLDSDEIVPIGDDNLYLGS
jgi:hypothetical protein